MPRDVFNFREHKQSFAEFVNVCLLCVCVCCLCVSDGVPTASSDWKPTRVERTPLAPHWTHNPTLVLVLGNPPRAAGFYVFSRFAQHKDIRYSQFNTRSLVCIMSALFDSSKFKIICDTTAFQRGTCIVIILVWIKTNFIVDNRYNVHFCNINIEPKPRLTRCQTQLGIYFGFVSPLSNSVGHTIHLCNK